MTQSLAIALTGLGDCRWLIAEQSHVVYCKRRAGFRSPSNEFGVVAH
jgi:hypothetical protein